MKSEFHLENDALYFCTCSFTDLGIFSLPDILQSFMGAWSHIYLNLLDVFYFYLHLTLTFQLKIQDIQVILYKASFYMIR